MDRRRLKFLLLGIGALGTMVFLLAVGISSSGGFLYYLTVSEFTDRGSQEGDNFRINGKVTTGTIHRMPGGSQVRFLMAEGGASLPVEFEGIIPDTFVDEADVVVEGHLRSDGTFEANLLLAKCPSKYEAAYEEGEAAPLPAGE